MNLAFSVNFSLNYKTEKRKKKGYFCTQHSPGLPGKGLSRTVEASF